MSRLKVGLRPVCRTNKCRAFSGFCQAVVTNRTSNLMLRISACHRKTIIRKFTYMELFVT